VTQTPAERSRSFDNVVDAYHASRPGYPAAAFDDLFRLLPERPLVLEVGPGTGQATRDLLDRGASVHAVEIGPNMAARLRDVLSSERLQVTVGDFETVALPERSFDAVFSANAYHWITPWAQVDRPSQLLGPRGLVAVLDLIQVDSSDDCGFFAAAQPIYERYGEGHTGPPAPRRDDVDPPMRAALDADPRFTDVEVRTYDWNQTYNSAEYRRVMLSYSGTQMMEPRARHGLLDDIETFVRDHFDDRVTRPLVVTLTIARLGG